MVKDSMFNKEARQRDMESGSSQALVAGNRGIESLLCTPGDCNHVRDPLSEWIVDTGATYHCVPKRELFITNKEGDVAKMRNNDVSQIVGICDIIVETSTGCTLTLRDARHILDMRINLLSINVLDKEGYESQKKNAQWKFLKSTLLVAKGKLCSSMYKT
ncbi:hypothetical protein RJ641_008908 [Dillenia turbinata]|uniref:Retrovirus-related Pol polyprotein from transposon TNT 1-94-like beta-barrel domain-containing protein n=1 Tax=Dillenia turbinata TaxID=194707 RepID=A0AAN8V5R3_9MAGN